MKKVITLITFFIIIASSAQDSPFGNLSYSKSKRQNPQKPIIYPQTSYTKSEASKCIRILNAMIEGGETKDYFKPDASTAIKESYLMLWQGEYYAIIIFTSSDKPYLYWTSPINWDNYISAGKYSAGKSFNTYIYPNKLCDY